VTLAAVIAATGVTKSKLSDQRYIIYGAGSAGLGITRQLRDGIVQIDGVPVEEANRKFFLIDRFGLVKKSLGPQKIRKDLNEFVRPDEEWNDVPANDHGEVRLLEVVKKIKPTVLIGCSTHAGGFTKDVLEAMAAGCERPIILPLSNPTRLAEVTPKDAIDWTGGKALIATGSPFEPVRLPNGQDYT
jgi:malate dehydrogenase (oxaloacetate-decarboxylating)